MRRSTRARSGALCECACRAYPDVEMGVKAAINASLTYRWNKRSHIVTLGILVSIILYLLTNQYALLNKGLLPPLS